MRSERVSLLPVYCTVHCTVHCTFVVKVLVFLGKGGGEKTTRKEDCLPCEPPRVLVARLDTIQYTIIPLVLLYYKKYSRSLRAMYCTVRASVQPLATTYL